DHRFARDWGKTADLSDGVEDRFVAGVRQTHHLLADVLSFGNNKEALAVVSEHVDTNFGIAEDSTQILLDAFPRLFDSQPSDSHRTIKAEIHRTISANDTLTFELAVGQALDQLYGQDIGRLDDVFNACSFCALIALGRSRGFSLARGGAANGTLERFG